MATFVLLAEAGPDAGRSFTIPHGGGIIGRHADAGIVLGDVQASRRHARLTVQGDKVTISDLGSANGTQVNDVPLAEPRTIRPGDTIALGGTTLRLALADKAPQPAPAPVQSAAGREGHTAMARPAASEGNSDSAITAGVTLNGRYRLDRQIGQGGFARVYVATDLALRRRIAIKVLHAELTEEGAGGDFLDRFAREAQSVAALEHPHILGVYDYGEAHGTVYIVMPFVEGGSLHDRLRRDGRPALPAIADYLRQTAAALDYAHRHNLVHRDLKPQNLLLTADDRLLLADFGIAKVVGGTGSQSRTGIIGTLSYMAPEQFQGKVVPATDIYALGCIVFQLLTGKLPYNGPTERVMYGHLTDPIPQLAVHRADLPATLQPIIDRALAKDASARFASAGALSDAFAQAISARPAAARLATPSAHEIATRIEENAPSYQAPTVVDHAPPQQFARTEVVPERPVSQPRSAVAPAPSFASNRPPTAPPPTAPREAATQMAGNTPFGFGAQGQATQVADFGAASRGGSAQTVTPAQTATTRVRTGWFWSLGWGGRVGVIVIVLGVLFHILRILAENGSISTQPFTSFAKLIPGGPGSAALVCWLVGVGLVSLDSFWRRVLRRAARAQGIAESAQPPQSMSDWLRTIGGIGYVGLFFIAAAAIVGTFWFVVENRRNLTLDPIRQNNLLRLSEEAPVGPGITATVCGLVGSSLIAFGRAQNRRRAREEAASKSAPLPPLLHFGPLLGTLVVSLLLGGAVFGLRSLSEKPPLAPISITPAVADAQHAQALALARRTNADAQLSEFQISCRDASRSESCGATYKYYSPRGERSYVYIFSSVQDTQPSQSVSEARPSERTILGQLPWQKNGNYGALAAAIYPQMPGVPPGQPYSLGFYTYPGVDYRGVLFTSTTPIIENWAFGFGFETLGGTYYTTTTLNIDGNRINVVSTKDERSPANRQLAVLVTVISFIVLSPIVVLVTRRRFLQRSIATA